MGRKALAPGAVIAPLPAVMVTCGDIHNANVLTIGWTGIVNTKPPMVYISVRPTRHSHSIIKEKGEFVINLTTSRLVRETDFVGVRSGRDIDKIKKCGLTLEEASVVSAPVIAESPLSLECKVREIHSFGSHDMFLADVVAISADERYIDSKGKINLQQAGLMAYSHGEYFALGRKLGDFGFSVAKKAKNKSYNRNIKTSGRKDGK